MKDDPVYLTKNNHGVYYYRRPISLEDQTFWRGPNGNPKKEWNKSLRTKDRREAILMLPDASDAYDAERAAQFLRNAGAAANGGRNETEAEREDREAHEAVEARRKERRNDHVRQEARKLYRQFRHMTTAELPPDKAAILDILREGDAELAKARELIVYLETQIGEHGGGASATSLPDENAPDSVERLLEAYEADKGPKCGQRRRQRRSCPYSGRYGRCSPVGRRGTLRGRRRATSWRF